jgi:hypothetical protein
VFAAKIYMRVRAYVKHTKYGYRLVYDFCSLNLGSSSSGIHLKHFRRLKTAQSNPLVSSASSHLNYHLVIVQASLAYESMTVNSNNQFTKIHPKIVTKD